MTAPISADALNTLGQSTATMGGEAVKSVVNDPAILITGILLIAAAIVIFYLVKKLIVNSILGFIGWIILVWFFKIEGMLLIPTLAVSVIFGLAGVGALLLLMFFGVF